MKPKPTKAEKREVKKKPKMPVSGKKVFALKEIIVKRGTKASK
jgi:hypothetical protein